METVKKFFKVHLLGICFAIIVGVFTGLPAAVAPILIGGDYHGVPFITNNDEQAYTAMIREILDGYPAVSSPNVYEYKHVRGLIPPVNEYFYAIPAFFFGLFPVIVASKFIFPGIIFFLVYFLFVSVVGVSGMKDGRVLKWSAIAAGLLAMLGMEALGYRQILALLDGQNHAMFSISWTRLVNPIIGGILMFGIILFLRRVIDGPGRAPIISAGVLLALSVGYFFSFGLSASIIAALLVLLVVFGERPAALRVAAVFLAGMIVATPYWVIVFTSMGGEEGKALAARNGMFYTHAPVLNNFLLLVTVCVVASAMYAYIRGRFAKQKKEWIFLFALLFGGWISLNQQIITGREVWFAHFTQYTVPIGFIVVLAATYMVWRRHFPRLYAAAVGSSIVLVTTILCLSSLSFRYFLDDYRSMQGNAEIYAFLNERMPKDCVVFIREEADPIEQMIPAHTHCNVYSTTHVFIGVPLERVRHNFLLRLRLNDVTPETAHDYLLEHERDVRTYFFDDWDEVFGSGHDPWFLAQIVELEKEYDNFLSGDLKSQILTYKMDLLASRSPLSETVMGKLPGLHLVSTSSGYYLYSF